MPGTAAGTARGEGGRLNLAFALFDSVVDDTPGRVPALARALAPDRLRTRMAHPDDDRAALTVELTELERWSPCSIQHSRTPAGVFARSPAAWSASGICSTPCS